MLKALHDARVARRAADPLLSSYDVAGHRLVIAEVPGSAIGSIVWEGCHVLRRFLADHPEVVRGKRVLELGSGVGLAGLAAASLGASHVMLTDTASLLTVLESNVARNSPGPGDRAAAAELSWGGDGWAAFCAQMPAPPAFDVIIAADIVYREESASALVATLAAAAAAAPTCTAMYMAYKERGAGPGFFKAAAAAGFSCTDVAPVDGVHRMLLVQLR